MAELTLDQKTELVTRIARFEPYADVAKEMSEKYQIALDRVQVRDYDPTKSGFAAGEKWRLIFTKAREDFLADMSAIPVASQTYRIMLFQRGIDAALAKEDWRLVALLAEQAARDLGGLYTRLRELTITPSEAKGPRCVARGAQADVRGPCAADDRADAALAGRGSHASDHAMKTRRTVFQQTLKTLRSVFRPALCGPFHPKCP